MLAFPPSKTNKITSGMSKAKIVVKQGEYVLLDEAGCDEALSVQVGSAAWYEWLASNRSFTFVGGAGQFSALKERVRDKGWYWKAYHWQNGRRRSIYLGRSEDLSIDRLEYAAKNILQTNASHEARTSQHIPRTKLFVPSLRPRRVVRQRLLQRLRNGAQLPITVVVAPAGYGKTTLITDWIYTDKREAAWLSLDDNDNAPNQFWASFGAALDAFQLGTSQNIKAELSALLQRPNPLSIMAALSNDFADRLKLDSRGRPKILVIDDLHVVTQPDLLQAIVYFVDHLPPSLHVVITTRLETHLPMVRWRVQHRLNELRAADLAFNNFETRAFLADTMNLKLVESAITALEERTEGWIAALQLAALSLQNHADPAVFIGHFRGNQQHVMSYLVDQVLARLPAPVLDFITRAAVLDRMCDDLCRALLDDPATPDTPTLRELEKANLFVIGMDEEGRWYRFHHLFAESLRARLNQDHPTLAPTLHQRAAQWYEEKGDIQQSIQQALLGEDYAHVARLAELDIAKSWSNQTIVATSSIWVDQLPDAFIRPSLTLILAKAGNLLRQLQVSAAIHWLDELDQALLHEQDREAVSIARARGTMLRAYALRMQHGDTQQVLELSAQALVMLSESDPVWRANALLTHAALIIVSSGDFYSAFQYSQEAAELSLQYGMRETHIECLSMNALHQCNCGRLRRAEIVMDSMRRLLEAWKLPNAIARNWRENVGMKLAYERNDLPTVEAIILPLLERTIVGQDQINIINAALRLFRVHLARGAYADALTMIDAVEPVCISSPFSAQYIVIMRAFLQAAQHDTALLESWVEEMMSRPSNSIWRVPGVQEDLRIWLARGHVWLNQPERACLVLDPYIDTLEKIKSIDALIRCLVLRALAREQSGSRAAALEDLRVALTLGKPEGYMRTFLDEGPAMINLLLDARAKNIEPAYVMKLLEAFEVGDAPAVEQQNGHPPLRAEPTPWVESISAREKQVLDLLAAGYTNQEIADTLGVTLTTVKSHAGSIYTKLGVKSRTQAIVRARELGLLG